ncbi:hypothetical protein KEM54_002223 [Ascosphaera aggregata]|nr:hypothetical protein KEM54_002223 [Ascosphaera aggregata]
MATAQVKSCASFFRQSKYSSLNSKPQSQKHPAWYVSATVVPLPCVKAFSKQAAWNFATTSYHHIEPIHIALLHWLNQMYLQIVPTVAVSTTMVNAIVSLVRERPRKPGQPARVYTKFLMENGSECVFLTTESTEGEATLQILHYDPELADNDQLSRYRSDVAEVAHLGHVDGSLLNPLEIPKHIMDIATTISPSYLTGLRLPSDQRKYTIQGIGGI